LNGQSHAITENLAIALRHLQHERKSLLLWIDSLCINQDDNNEKGLQVQRMGKTYSGAAVVLSWLGPEDLPSTIAMTKLSKLNQWFENNIHNADFPENTDPALWAPVLNNWVLNVFANLKPGNDHESDVPYAFIVKILSRPYWHRLWIQQELYLGKETILVCGRQDLDIQMLLTGIDVSIQLAGRFSDGWSADLKSASDGLLYETGPAIIMFYRNGNDPLRELLYRATFPRPGGSLKAFDRRDMVYGLLTISNDAKVLRILPDYSKTWQDVYREVTETYIKQGDLSILSFAGLSPAQPDLPSWVPDWSQSLKSVPVSRH
jgi:Heterokaryon incompatibility protein (HET)